MSVRCLRLANSLQRSFASQLISSRLPSTLTNLNPQRRAASSSNTLLPIDQETPQILPTPDDFANDVQLAGLGYPQTPNVSRQHRPAKGWWDEQDRCNYGEVLNENDDILSMWGPDVHSIPPSRAFAMLALASGIMASVCTFFVLITPEKPAVKRVYPYDGLVRELSGTDDQIYAAVPKTQAKNDEEDEDE